MALRINDTVPDFEAETSQGTIRFHDWIGDGWAILFSHPKDFTPVCTTEFGAVAQLADAWAKRKTKVIGVSVDKVEDHTRWTGDIESFADAKVNFPIIADEGLKISKAFDMLPAEAYLPDGRTPARQRHGSVGLNHRPRQEAEAVDDLSDDHRPQLRRNPARAGRAATDLWRADRRAGELGGRAGRDRRHLAGRCRGRGQVRQAGQAACPICASPSRRPDQTATGCQPSGRMSGLCIFGSPNQRAGAATSRPGFAFSHAPHQENELLAITWWSHSAISRRSS